MKNRGFSTRAIHGRARPDAPGEPVVQPVVTATTFSFDDAATFGRVMSEEEYGFLYSRLRNPTVEELNGVLADLEDAEAAIMSGSGAPRGTIRAVFPLSFGRVTLAPELPKFFARYPEISLEMHFNDSAVDLIAEGYELAVRTGHPTDSRLTTRLLTKGPQVTVAAPSYLARRGEPMTPPELRQHNCLISRFGTDWTYKGKDGQTFTVRVRGSALINSGDVLRETVVAGGGIAQGTWWLYRKDLGRGEVKAILRDYEIEGAPVSVLYPPQRHLPAKLRAFIDFLAQITKSG